MNKKFNKNAKVEKFSTMLGIAVRLIVIDPFSYPVYFCLKLFLIGMNVFFDRAKGYKLYRLIFFEIFVSKMGHFGQNLPCPRHILITGNVNF